MKNIAIVKEVGDVSITAHKVHVNLPDRTKMELTRFPRIANLASMLLTLKKGDILVTDIKFADREISIFDSHGILIFRSSSENLPNTIDSVAKDLGVNLGVVPCDNDEGTSQVMFLEGDSYRIEIGMNNRGSLSYVNVGTLDLLTKEFYVSHTITPNAEAGDFDVYTHESEVD